MPQFYQGYCQFHRMYFLLVYWWLFSALWLSIVLLEYDILGLKLWLLEQPQLLWFVQADFENIPLVNSVFLIFSLIIVFLISSYHFYCFQFSEQILIEDLLQPHLVRSDYYWWNFLVLFCVLGFTLCLILLRQTFSVYFRYMN